MVEKVFECVFRLPNGQTNDRTQHFPHEKRSEVFTLSPEFSPPFFALGLVVVWLHSLSLSVRKTNIRLVLRHTTTVSLLTPLFDLSKCEGLNLLELKWAEIRYFLPFLLLFLSFLRCTLNL